MKNATITTDTNTTDKSNDKDNQEVTFKAKVDVTDSEIEKLKESYPAELKNFNPAVEGNTLILSMTKQYGADASDQDINIDKDRFRDDVESHLSTLFPNDGVETSQA